MEKVYAKFGIKKKDSDTLFNTVNLELKEAMPIFSHFFRTYKNRQTTYLLSNLQIIEMILNNLKDISDTTQRGVVLNLSHEIIEKSKNLLGYMNPPINTDSVKPQFIEIAEIESFLREYCDTRNIIKDPFNQPIEKVISVEEAKRISKTLSKIQMF